uniref:Cadherin-related family member 4-like isoform X1 n=1 Tax=Petromyzon marinus TaxID=7757 RepID=A0AAJ7T3C7_PETMA|nr:cadherin-related family member 4-like isoform X1 [Petromyzon marinus]
MYSTMSRGPCERFPMPIIAWCFLIFSGLSSTHAVLTFTWTPSVAYLQENSPNLAIVANINVTSDTQNINGLVFTVTPPGPFQLIDNTPSAPGFSFIGQVILNSAIGGHLDYETLNLYQLTVSAQEPVGTTVSSSIYINVTNVNEAPTCNGVFSAPGATIRVREDEQPNAVIYRVPATDQDAGDTLTFTWLSVVPASGATRLQFNTLNGVIRVPATGFDYEVDKNYLLQIIVNDSKGLSCNGSVSIIIVDSKDEPPGFTGPASTTITILEELPQNTLVTTVTSNDTTVYFELVSPAEGFYIESATGKLKTAYQLDVDNNPLLQINNIVVKVTNYISKLSATLNLKVNVADVNDNPPICTSYHHIYMISEGAVAGTSITTLTCWDHDVTSINNALTYKLISDVNALSRFALTGSTLQILTNLNYDLFALAFVDFQYTLVIEVQDISHTTNVTVMVVLTPVNEYNPSCNILQAFSISEDSPVGALIGAPVCWDADYPFNNLKYSIISGNTDIPTPFYINPKNGQIKVLNTLDREKKSFYPMTVQVVDLNNDIAADPLHQRTSTVDFSIFVTNVNDEPPVCTPAFYEQTIYSTLAAFQSVVQMQCSDLDSLALDLEYRIIGGNTNGRFVLSNARPPAVLTRSIFSYFTLGGVTDPKDFQLLVLIEDEATNPDKTRRLSSTATILIHVVPWTTTVPPPATVLTTKIINVVDTYWKPDTWFIAVMVIAGLLLLLTIVLISYCCWKSMPCCWKCCKPSQPVDEKPLLEANKMKEPHNTPEDPPNNIPRDPINSERTRETPPPSYGFDGRAEDPSSGREYVFNSATGERRWL